MENLQIVCEYHFKDPNNQIATEIEIVEFPERQRGIWNQSVVTWWIKGDTRDDAFEDREAFLKRVFNIAFTEWDIEIPVIFVQAVFEEAADIIIEFGTRVDDPYYSDRPMVLAYAGFPDGSLRGYIKFITDWNWNAHGLTGINILIVMEHELGHTIGLTHSLRKLGLDLLDPSYNRKILDASDYDIERAVGAYGPRIYEEPTHHDRLEKANSLSKERLQAEEIAKS